MSDFKSNIDVDKIANHWIEKIKIMVMVVNRHKFMGSEAVNVPLVLFEEAANYILNRINVLISQT